VAAAVEAEFGIKRLPAQEASVLHEGAACDRVGDMLLRRTS
jgi:hypothetical protein